MEWLNQFFIFIFSAQECAVARANAFNLDISGFSDNFYLDPATRREAEVHCCPHVILVPVDGHTLCWVETVKGF